MAKIETQMYMSFSDKGPAALPVASFGAAMEEALASSANFFHTHEISSVKIGDRTFTEKPVYHPGRIFVCVSETQTHQQYMDAYAAQIEKLREERLGIKFGFFARKEKILADQLDDRIGAMDGILHFMRREHKPDDVWVRQRDNNWILLSKNDQAYDGEGNKIWPLPAAKPEAQSAPHA